MSASALIVGCSGLTLTADEISFFQDVNPWGFILFKRNIDTPEQVKALTDALRATIGRDNAPILIDQEGGRVQRLGSPHWPVYPPGAVYGRLYKQDHNIGREITRLGARLIAHDLKVLGINADCVPVLDMPVVGAHDIIGDRAYGHDIETIAVLGRAASEGLLAGGVLPVIKHIPGHGRANADSHEALPIVDTAKAELKETDFKPFAMLADMPLAMTAHVVYSDIDADEPATHSKKIIKKIIRNHIGFAGLLMSDDLSMQALSGSLRKRAERAIAAGCDVVLHCNGDLTEMQAVAQSVPRLEAKAKQRAQTALDRIAHIPEPFDEVSARIRFESVIKTVS